VIALPDSPTRPADSKAPIALPDSPTKPGAAPEVIALPDSPTRPADSKAADTEKLQDALEYMQEAPAVIALPDSPNRPAPSAEAALELPDGPVLAATATTLPDGPSRVSTSADLADVLAQPVEKVEPAASKTVVDYTNSEQDIMENVDLDAEVSQVHPSSLQDVLYDTADKEILAELASTATDLFGKKDEGAAALGAGPAAAAEAPKADDASAVPETAVEVPAAANDVPPAIASEVPATTAVPAATEVTEVPAVAAGPSTSEAIADTKLPAAAELPPADTKEPEVEAVPAAAADSTTDAAIAPGAAETAVVDKAAALLPELPSAAEPTGPTEPAEAQAQQVDGSSAAQGDAAAEAIKPTAEIPPAEELLLPSEPTAPKVEAWGTGPVPPEEPAPSADDLQKKYLEELQRQQEEAEAAEKAALAAEQEKGNKPRMQDAEAEEVPGASALLDEVSGATALLREALRLVVPDTWDSEDEAKTGRKRPDVSRLNSCWEILEQDLQTAEEAEHERLEEEMARATHRSMADIEAQENELKERLEVRAKAAESKLDPTKAQAFRQMSWSVVNTAEAAKEKCQVAKATRIGLARKKVQSRRRAVVEAMSETPWNAAGAAVLDLQLPNAEALQKVSAFEALAEVSEAIRACFSSLQVVALRPLDADAAEIRPSSVNPDAPPKPVVTQGWGEKSAADPSPKLSAWDENAGKDKEQLVNSTLAALPLLQSSLAALEKRLQLEQAEMPEVDAELRKVATDEDKMTKDQKREAVMFAGQQEYDWQRGIDTKMKEQGKKRQEHVQASLDRVSRVLARRWQRQVKREKAKSMEELNNFIAALDEAEAAQKHMKQENYEATGKEAQSLEDERRGLQEQTQALLLAALFIRQEKARMDKAWYCEVPKEKRELLFKSLRIIRRVHLDMKGFQVHPEFQQKHSILLYSLRQLEGRLLRDCPGATDADIHEGPMEETKEQKQQLAEAAASFEDQLWADVDALRARNNRKAEKAMAQDAARRRREAEAEHLPKLLAASSAMRSAEQSARRAEISSEILRPIAILAAELAAEAFRHAQVVGGELEPASFAPQRKRLEACLKATLKVIQDVGSKLSSEEILAAASQPNKMGKDPAWEGLLEKTKQRWKDFCDSYPDVVEDAPETPRDEGAKNKSMLDSTLEVADLEDDPVKPAAKSPANKGRGGTSGSPTRNASSGSPTRNARGSVSAPALPAAQAQGSRKPSAPPPSRVPAAKKAPGRPPSAGSSRPPVSTKPPVPGGKATAASAGAAQGTSASGGKKGAALLAQLDELSTQMDRALGKNGTFSQKQMQTNGSSPVGGAKAPNVKPPAAAKGVKR